ncbi:MAG: heterodisulfide reductase-related iron-sulfur binding cluster [Myxococcota bacterium]|jgi:heterodisulfide reductase subunit B
MPGKHLFYPGCSLEAGGGYLESLNAVMKALGEELPELPDWNCCGSTMLKAYNRGTSAVTAARNFSIAKKNGAGTIVVICNACLSTLIEQRNYLRDNPALAARAADALAAAGHELVLDIEIKHLLDYIVDDVGLDRVKALVKKPLEGLNLGAYYGCLYTRPARPGIDSDDPQYLERLITVLGGNAVPFNAKSYCCGASQVVGHPDIGKGLAKGIMTFASHKGIDGLLSICPMCNFNLETYSGADALENPAGVLFFTQAMGIAFGLGEEELGTGKLLLPPRKLVGSLTATL